MSFKSCRRRVALAVLVGAIATAGTAFAPSAVARNSPVVLSINCASLGGVGTVNVFANGVGKGHCSFPGGFPNLGLGLPNPLPHAVHVSCAQLAVALQLPVIGTPTGQATLTPSGNANVNCRNVVLPLNGFGGF